MCKCFHKTAVTRDLFKVQRFAGACWKFITNDLSIHTNCFCGISDTYF